MKRIRSGASDVRALMNDAVAPFRRNAHRALLRLGTLTLGLTGIAAALLLTSTAANEISTEFDRQRPSSVSASLIGETRALVEGKALAIDGVLGDGLVAEWPDEMSVRNRYAPEASIAPAELWGVTSSFISTARLDIGPSGVPALWSGKVALLGSQMAVGLTLGPDQLTSVVLIEGVPFSVVGVVTDSDLRSELLFGVLIPYSTALDVFGPPQTTSLLVSTEDHASEVVAAQLPLLLLPDDPDAVQTFIAAHDRELRDSVSEQARLGSVATAVLVALIGAAGIAVSSSADVARRVPELGLRRALGATPRQILLLIIAETTIAGLAAGLAGAWCGLGASFLVSLSLGWDPIIDPRLWVGLPLLGALIGVVAGYWPALRASQISPRAALTD